MQTQQQAFSSSKHMSHNICARRPRIHKSCHHSRRGAYLPSAHKSESEVRLLDKRRQLCVIKDRKHTDAAAGLVLQPHEPRHLI